MRIGTAIITEIIFFASPERIWRVMRSYSSVVPDGIVISPPTMVGILFSPQRFPQW